MRGTQGHILRLYDMIDISENAQRFMMHNFKNIESWKDKVSDT